MAVSSYGQLSRASPHGEELTNMWNSTPSLSLYPKPLLGMKMDWSTSPGCLLYGDNWKEERTSFIHSDIEIALLLNNVCYVYIFLIGLWSCFFSCFRVVFFHAFKWCFLLS